MGSWEPIEGANIELTNARGQLGKDPKAVYLRDNTVAANLSVAVDRNRFNRDTNRWETTGTAWYEVSVYGAQAENVLASLKSGNSVLLSGRGQVLSRAEMSESGEPRIRTINALNQNVIVAPDLSRSIVSIEPGARAQVRQTQAQAEAQAQAQAGHQPQAAGNATYAQNSAQVWQNPVNPGQGWPTAVPGSGGSEVRIY